MDDEKPEKIKAYIEAGIVDLYNLKFACRCCYMARLNSTFDYSIMAVGAGTVFLPHHI